MSEISLDEQQQPNKLLSLFTNFIHQNKPKSKTAAFVVENEDETNKLNNNNNSISLSEKTPNFVRVSMKPAVVVEPLTIECEQEAEKSTTPAVLWQVYALGGILMLRWAWARWNERKPGKGSSHH